MVNRSHIIITALGCLTLAALISVLAARSDTVASTGTIGTALSIWRGPLVTGRVIQKEVAPMPAEPAPLSQSVPGETPCPANLHINSSGPNAHINYHCKSTLSGNSSRSTTTSSGSISISNSSSQSSSGGSSSSNNSVNISITNN